MTALDQDRNTPERSSDKRALPVKAATKIFAGSIVAVDSTGHAVPMTTATDLKGIGRANIFTDNSGGANGAKTIEVETGVFRYANSAAADALARADIGSDCYGVDDQTVAKTNGTNTRSIAGKVFDVDAQGVWVKFS